MSTFGKPNTMTFIRLQSHHSALFCQLWNLWRLSKCLKSWETWERVCQPKGPKVCLKMSVKLNTADIPMFGGIWRELICFVASQVARLPFPLSKKSRRLTCMGFSSTAAAFWRQAHPDMAKWTRTGGSKNQTVRHTEGWQTHARYLAAGEQDTHGQSVSRWCPPASSKNILIIWRANYSSSRQNRTEIHTSPPQLTDGPAGWMRYARLYSTRLLSERSSSLIRLKEPWNKVFDIMGREC